MKRVLLTLAALTLLTSCQKSVTQVEAVHSFFSALNSGDLVKARTLTTGNISDSNLGSKLSVDQTEMWKSIWSHVQVSNLKLDSDPKDLEVATVKGDINTVDFEEMSRSRRFESGYPTAREIIEALSKEDLPMKSFSYDFVVLKDADVWRIAPITNFEEVITH